LQGKRETNRKAWRSRGIRNEEGIGEVGRLGNKGKKSYKCDMKGRRGG
jgi:hypothetical protein